MINLLRPLRSTDYDHKGSIHVSATKKAKFVGKSRRLMKRLDQAVRPLHYMLDLAIDPDSAVFSGRVDIDIACDHTCSDIELHALGLSFDSILLQSDESEAQSGSLTQLDSGTIQLRFATPLAPGSHKLHFTYTAPYSSGLEGLYRSKIGTSWSAFTQFEAIGARRCFPCFDEPGFKAPFSVTVTVPERCEVFANSGELKRKNLSRQKTIVFAQTKPLPTYLVALAVGEFDVVSIPPIAPGNVARDPLPVRAIARKGQGKNFRTALGWVAPIILAAEEYFGIAFPFGKLDFMAVPDFAAGGMENAGLIMFEESLILLDEDSSFEQNRDVLTTLAHEISHHWFGNLVSPAWWDDLWLNESFATLMEAKISNQLKPDWGYDTDLQQNAADAMRLDLLPSVRRVHEPVTDEDDITAAFDAITYQKGSVALAMLEDEMGHAAFRSVVQNFLIQNRYGSYDTAKFLALIESNLANNKDSFFKKLIDETGIPVSTDANFILSGDDAPYYLRARLPNDHWQKIFNDANSIGRPEALRALLSLDLALQKQELELEVYLSGVRAFATRPEWEIAGFPLNRLEFLIAERPQLVRIREFSAELYESQLTGMGTASSETKSEFADWRFIIKRERLAMFFAATDCSPSSELDLLHAGLRLLESPKNTFEVEWYPREMKEAALLAAIRSKNAEISERLVQMLKATDISWQRDLVLGVIAADLSPGNDARMRKLLVSDTLMNHEIPTYLAARATIPESRDDLLEFVGENAMALLKRLDGDADIGIIQFADGFTTAQQADRLQTLMTPVIGSVRGGGPQLKLTLEKIALHANMLAHIDG